MKASLECIPCFVRQSLEGVQFATSDVALQARMMREVLREAADFDLQQSAPAVNDGTSLDARTAGLDQIAEVIDNGSDAPGTILEDCSPAFRNRFEKADLVIAKGQGNSETLSDHPANIFFLLKIKCPLVAAHTGLHVGTHALIRRDVSGRSSQSQESQTE